MKNPQIIKAFDAVRDACTTVQTQLSLDSGTDVYGIFIYNLESFLFYLSASDGMISHHEVNFINDNFGASFTAQKIRQMIIDGNVSEEEVKNFNIYITNLKQHIDEEKHKDENVPFPPDEGKAAAPVHQPEENEPAEDLPSLLQELQGLVGLENVKSDVSTMINLLAGTL